MNFVGKVCLNAKKGRLIKDCAEDPGQDMCEEDLFVKQRCVIYVGDFDLQPKKPRKATKKPKDHKM